MSSFSAPVVSLSSSMSTSSPLVAKVLERKRRLYESRSKWKWALVNFFSAFLMFIEAHRSHFVLEEKSSWRAIVSLIETLLLVVLLTNAILDLLHHFFPFFNLRSVFVGGSSFVGKDQDIVLTRKQMTLFGIGKNDQGFKISHETIKEAKKDKESHPFGFGSPLDGSFITSTPGSHSPFGKSPQGASLDSSSWHYCRPSTNSSQSNHPTNDMNTSCSPKFVSTFHGEIVKDQKSLKKFLNEYDSWERSNQQLNASSVSFNEGDFSGSFNATGHSQPATFWRQNRGSSYSNNLSPQSPRQDYSPFLRKIAYQVSSPMPERPSETTTTSPQNLASTPKSPTSSSSNESICAGLAVGPLELVACLENLRMWISQTVLRRVVDEISNTNDLLVKHGMSDERIGLIGIEKLKKVALMPHILHHVPSLDALVPFLDFHNNQEYLVKRYRELCEGGAMSGYRWNSGGKFKSWEWNDKLPTDAEIVMNAVAAYLDTRLPSNFVYNDGKPFTGVYYVKFSPADASTIKSADDSKSASSEQLQSPRSRLTPDIQALLALSPKNTEATGAGETFDKNSETAELAAKHRSCVIVQVSQKPPRFELHLKDPKCKRKGEVREAKSSKNAEDVEKIEVGPGRNNLFHTILLFLHHIKTREGGTLERINFGASGVNLLWVIGER